MNLKFISAVFIILGGCATYHPQPISPARTAADFEARSLGSPELHEYLKQYLHRDIRQWPPESWDFTMLALAAFYYHPDMDVARAKWEVAAAEVISAGGRPNPGLSVLGQHHSNTAGGISPWTWGVSLDIPVETAGKRGYRIEKARHLSEAARLNVAAVEWRIWSRLRKGLLNLYVTTNRERFLNDHLMIQRQIELLMEKRVSEGESSRVEDARARLDLAKTRLLLAEAQKQKMEARTVVAEALGLQVTALDGIDITFGSFEKFPERVSLQEIRSQALSNRPDILAALSEYEASQSTLQLEIAKQYPDIHLGPGYEWDQGDSKWSFGLKVELPVFNRNRGPIEAAKARRKESAARFLALQAGVIGEIGRSQAAYNEALKKLQLADDLASIGKKHLEMIKGRFNAGEADRLELETAMLEFSASELSRFDIFASAQENLGALEDAIQRPLMPLEIPPIAAPKSTAMENR